MAVRRPFIWPGIPCPPREKYRPYKRIDLSDKFAFTMNASLGEPKEINEKAFGR